MEQLTWREHISTKRKQLELKFRKCTGTLAENRGYHGKTCYWYTEQSRNLSGPMAYNCGDQHQTVI